MEGLVRSSWELQALCRSRCTSRPDWLVLLSILAIFILLFFLGRSVFFPILDTIKLVQIHTLDVAHEKYIDLVCLVRFWRERFWQKFHKPVGDWSKFIWIYQFCISKLLRGCPESWFYFSLGCNTFTAHVQWRTRGHSPPKLLKLHWWKILWVSTVWVQLIYVIAHIAYKFFRYVQICLNESVYINGVWFEVSKPRKTISLCKLPNHFWMKISYGRKTLNYTCNTHQVNARFTQQPAKHSIQMLWIKGQYRPLYPCPVGPIQKKTFKIKTNCCEAFPKPAFPYFASCGCWKGLARPQINI